MSDASGNPLFEKILLSKTILVLSGAGISTEAGIPDFKQLDDSWDYRWPRNVVFSNKFLNRFPDKFWSKFYEVFLQYDGLTPTQTHYDLAKLESLGANVAIITQNVDGLHQKAGSQKVYEAHGNLKTVYCGRKKCSWSGDFTQEIKDESKDHAPKCPQCNFYLRPNVVLFGENVSLPLGEDFLKLEKLDSLLTIGTSGEVYPIAGIPRMIKESLPEVFTVWLNKVSSNSNLYNAEAIGSLNDFSDEFRSYANW